MKSLHHLSITILLAGALHAAWADEIKPLNSIAAEVNASIITYGDIDRMMRILKSSTNDPNISDEQFVRAAKTRLMERALLAYAARQQQLRVNQTGIDQELQRRAQLGNTTVEALYLQAGNLGYTRESFRTEVAKDLLIDYMLEGINANIKIDDAQIKEVFKSGQVPAGEPYTVYTIRRIILNSDSEANMPATESRLQQIAQAIEHGSDFATLAKRYSQEVAANNGGIHDNITDFMLPENVERALHQLSPNQMSLPLRSGKSWQIIQLISTRTEDNPEKMQYEAVRRQLYQAEQQRNHEQFIGQLQQNAVVREY